MMDSTLGALRVQVAVSVRPDRVIADLRELADLTGGPDGARRVCWTDEWEEARAWLRGKLAELPCTIEVDQAGNLWATIQGQTPGVVVVGSHIDSVPHGGWLDGCLGIPRPWRCCGSTRRRRRPPRCVWSIGPTRRARALAAAFLVPAPLPARSTPMSVRGLRDRDGITLPDALAACGVELDRALESGSRLKGSSLSGSAHRAGPRAGAAGYPDWSCAGHVWRGAARYPLYGPHQPCRLDADGYAPRRAAQRRPASRWRRAKAPSDGAAWPLAASSPSSRASSPPSPAHARSRWISARSMPTPWPGCSPMHTRPASVLLPRKAVPSSGSTFGTSSRSRSTPR